VVKFEVLKATHVKIAVFLDVAPYILVDTHILEELTAFTISVDDCGSMQFYPVTCYFITFSSK
jgi:hypothetical protein